MIWKNEVTLYNKVDEEMMWICVNWKNCAMYDVKRKKETSYVINEIEDESILSVLMEEKRKDWGLNIVGEEDKRN